MSNFTGLHLTNEIFRILTSVFTILVKFDCHFLELTLEIFFDVTSDDLLHLKPFKNVKKNAIWVEIFRFKVFVLSK